jgi:hypothetical protein
LLEIRGMNSLTVLVSFDRADYLLLYVDIYRDQLQE